MCIRDSTYTVASTITTSSIETPSVTASLLEVTDSHSTYSSEKPLATFSLLDDASKVATTSTVVSTPSTTKTLSPAKSTDSSISSVTSAATMPKPSRITSTLEPSGTTTTTSYTTTTTTSSSSTPTSVSYTHLDVYKRQVYGHNVSYLERTRKPYQLCIG